MKAIFTYPNNSGTSFIDPTYIGDDTVGFQKRIKDLVDGNYKAWTGTIPSDTVSNIMSELSKFNEASQLETSGNNTIFNFWESPLYTANMELISSNISSATATVGVTSDIEFASNHGFYNSQLMTLSGFDGSWGEINGNSYYVKKIDADTIQLATDVNLTQPLQFFDQENSSISSATVGSTALFTDADASHDLTNGTHVQLSNFNGSFSLYNGSNFYIQNVTSSTFNLSFDSGGSQLFGLPNVENNVLLSDIVFESDNSVIVRMPNTETLFPQGTEVTFDPNDATTHGDLGINTGLSTILSGLPGPFLKPTATAHEYILYSDSGCTNLISWTAVADALNNWNQAGKATPITLLRAGSVYYLQYTFTGVGGVNLDGKKAYMPGPNMPISFNGSDSTSNTPYYVDSGLGANNYHLYDDVAKTTRQRIEYDIVNAKRIKYITSDPLVTIPKKYDSAGVEIDSGAFVIDDSTITSLTTLDGWKNNTNWSLNQALNIDNLPTTTATNLRFTRRAATYGSNAEPVFDFSDTAAAFVVTQDFDTSSYTTYTAEETSPGNDNFFEIRDVGVSNSGTALINQITSMITADPQSVYGVPFLTECGWQTSGSGTFNSNGQFWMVITLSKNPGVNTSGQTYQFRLYNKETDGSIGRECVSTDFQNETNPFSVPANTPGTNFGVFKTYLQPFYDVDERGVAVEAASTSWSYINESPGRDALRVQIAINTGATASFNTGQKCFLEVKDKTSHETVATYTDLAVFNKMDPNQGFTGQIFFAKLDSNGNWDSTTSGTNGNSGVGWRGGNLPSLYSNANHYININVLADTFWNRATNVGFYQVPADNYFITSANLNTNLTNGTTNVIQTSTSETRVTTLDTQQVPWTAATAGDVVEIVNPATPNIIPVKDIAAATTGTLTIEASRQYRYRVSSVSEHMYGNQTYLQRTGASTYVNNATIKVGDYIYAGASSNQTNYNLWPSFTVPTNVSGYLTSGFAFDTEFPGAFPNSEEHMFFPQTAADTYTPPALTPAQQADVFDTDDEWADYGFAGGRKVWPFHVTPSKADIVYNAPTIANMSQSGIKYTRSVGHTDWRLDVAYPPMTHSEFQKFHAIAQAAQGQAMPFFFVLRDKTGGPILWKKFEDTNVSTNSPRFKNPVALGDRLALTEGFQSNESNAFLQGEVFIDGNNDNGYLHTVLNQVDANVFGEAKIRTPWPFREAVVAGELLYKEPAHVVVTLANDNFEYKVDTNGYYYVSVSFDLDDWK